MNSRALLRALRMLLAPVLVAASLVPHACAAGAPALLDGAPTAPASAPAVLSGASAVAASAPAIPARTPAPAQAAAHQSREKTVIRAVTADPVFGGKRQDYEWHYTGETRSDTPEKNVQTPAWLRALLDAIEFVGRALRVLVWIGLAMLIAAIIYLAYRYRDAWIGPLRGRPAPPEFLFGLDVRPGSLPDDVAAAALQELARGNAAGALSLLYRGALVSLIHRSQLDFHAGHTEGDCLRLVRAAVDAGSSGYFGELLDAWKRTAYGHEPPPVPALESLCTRWRTHFAQVEAAR